MPRTRPEHYEDYRDMTEVVPGVFIDPGYGVYIVDDEGEVVCWVGTEFDDTFAVTAALSAVALATSKGAAAVRRNLADRGEVLDSLLEETHDAVCENCGHVCDASCDKCGGDPMQDGDRFCVDCDAQQRDQAQV